MTVEERLTAAGIEPDENIVRALEVLGASIGRNATDIVDVFIMCAETCRKEHQEGKINQFLKVGIPLVQYFPRGVND